MSIKKIEDGRIMVSLYDKENDIDSYMTSSGYCLTLFFTAEQWDKLRNMEIEEEDVAGAENDRLSREASNEQAGR